MVTGMISETGMESGLGKRNLNFFLQQKQWINPLNPTYSTLDNVGVQI